MTDDWQRRVDAVWAADLPDDVLLAEVSALAEELDDGDARRWFELAGAHDSTGHEVEAAAHYERALSLGLGPEQHAQATVQYASTLRNLGRPDAAIELLERLPRLSPVGTARDAFLALALRDLGRSHEALRVLLDALVPTLPRYQRSVTAYAAMLTESE